MTLLRSLTQAEFYTECERVQSERERKTAILAGLQFLAATSTALGLTDILQLIAVASVASTFTLPLWPFYLILGLGIACGLWWAYKTAEKGVFENDDEIKLMKECFEKGQAYSKRLTELEELLNALLAIKDNEYLRKRLMMLQGKPNEKETQRIIQEINGYIELEFSNKDPLKILLTKKPVEMETGEPTEETSKNTPRLDRNVNIKNGFFEGAGVIIGIIGSLAGFLLSASPIGWVVLSACLLLALVVGAVVIFHYHIEKKQELRHEELVQERELSISMLNRIEMTIKSIGHYAVSIGVQDKIAPAITEQEHINNERIIVLPTLQPTFNALDNHQADLSFSYSPI